MFPDLGSVTLRDEAKPYIERLEKKRYVAR